MLGAVAGHAPGPDLAAVGDEPAQQRGVLVIDVGDLVLAEHANLLLRFADWRLGHLGALPLQSPARWREWSVGCWFRFVVRTVVRPSNRTPRLRPRRRPS